MRSALASILIVLQYAAQLQCRSVTRAHPSLRTAPSSREDLGSLIARNREITDLLIPLLEANLETKRQESKRSDLLKVFRDPKARKDPVVEILPLTKRQTRDRKPLALILASELRSQKSKIGRNKVHAQKAFIIQNEEKGSSEEDYYNNDDDKNTVEESDEDSIIQSKYKRPIVKHEHWNSEESSGDDSFDDEYDVESKDKYHHNVVKETSEDENDVTEEQEGKKKHKDVKQSFNSQLIESFSEEYDETKSSESGNEEKQLSEANVNTVKESETETPEHVNIKEVLSQSVENSEESSHDQNKLKLEKPEKDKSSSYEETEEIGDDIARRYKKRRKPKKKYYQSSSSSEERKRFRSSEENKSYNVNPVVQNGPINTWNIESGSVSDEFLYDDEDEQSYESVIYASSEENQVYEDQNTNEVESQYDDYVTNENNLSEPDINNDDYLDVSDYYENVGEGSNEDVEYEDENNDSGDFSSESTEYTEIENYGGFDVELDNQGYNDYEDTDTGYYDTADDYSGGRSVETSYDDFSSDNDDTYSDDNNYDSYEYRQAYKDENKTKLTFSEEIAKKYAADSKYSVENDNSLTEPEGELGKFNVESVEGLIEVLKLDDNDDKSKCKDDDEVDENTSVENHSHEVHKSYKLSFKFNK